MRLTFSLKQGDVNLFFAAITPISSVFSKGYKIDPIKASKREDYEILSVISRTLSNEYDFSKKVKFFQP